MPQPIIIPLGDSRDIIIDLKDEAGVRQTLVGATITFDVFRGHARGSTGFVQKTVGAGITVDGTSLFATVAIAAGDLAVKGTLLAVACFKWSGKQFSAVTDLIVE